MSVSVIILYSPIVRLRVDFPRTHDVSVSESAPCPCPCLSPCLCPCPCLSPSALTLSPALATASALASALALASASRPASRPALGPNVPQVLPRSTLELKVRQSGWYLQMGIRDRRFLMLLGRRSAKVAPKHVLSAQTRFGAPKTLRNVGHVCQSAAWVILERKELQRRHWSDLERLDPSEPPKTSITYDKT